MKTAIDTVTHKLGLKLWSSNGGYIKPAMDLYDNGVFDYVELYIVPGTWQSSLHQWKQAKFPFFLHAPHSYGGLNFSLKEFEADNRTFVEEVKSFQTALNPGLVIFHPGIQGSMGETIRQIKVFKKEFSDLFEIAVLENKPKVGLKGEVCVGASPEEMEEILTETGLGFCLDIGHAICYSAWKRIGYEHTLDEFIKLQPKIFHLSDGDMNSSADMHINFGKGNFKLDTIISKIPSDAYVSIETEKKLKSDLSDFEEDVAYFKNVHRRIKA